MKSGVKLSNENLHIRFIWQWYTDQLNAINESKKKLLEELLTGIIRDFQDLSFSTHAEIENYFQECIAELELLVCFNIVAAAEAKIREHFISKIDLGRSADPLVNEYKSIFRKKNLDMRRVSLKDDIFKLWKKEMPGISGSIQKFDECLKFRNWLAHGRYWNGNYRTFIPIDVNDVAVNLFRKFSYIDNWE
jgi:hypothetical protein